MLDPELGAEFLPILTNGPHAMRANREHLPYLCRAQRLDIRLRHGLEQIVVAEPPRGIARALLLAQHAESDPEMVQDARQRQVDLAPLRIVSAHASQPETILLRAIVDG